MTWGIIIGLGIAYIGGRLYGIWGVVGAIVAYVALLSFLGSRIKGTTDAPQILVRSGPNKVADSTTKVQILNSLMEGRVRDDISIDGAEILLERGEKPIWGFGNVKWQTSHTRTRTRYVGGSHGGSFRIMKGLSFRVSSFSGTPIKTQEVSHEEQSGILIVASRNLYFRAGRKVTKIPIRKILSVHASADGIEITRDGKGAEPETFSVDDPSFAADAITRLCQIKT